MTGTTKAPENTAVIERAERDAATKAADFARGHRTTVIVVWIGFILIAALGFFMVTRPPVEDAPPVSLGVSFNSFFKWIGSLGPIVQIPIILVVFGIVVGILLLLIEYAPRHGTGYFWLRLVACFAIPVLAFLLLRPYQNAVVYVLAIAVLLGAILFYADYRARQGAGYLFQLVLFSAPAFILLLIGLI